MPHADGTPTPLEVWLEAGQDPGRYGQLMDERGLLPYRVLVTSSRTWTDVSTIRHDLANLLRARGRLVVVHGDCETGGDAIADQWALDAIASGAPVTVERHPADWRRHGKAAGPIRNNEMVKAGAGVCLAYIRDASRGASHCAAAALEAGIETRVVQFRSLSPTRL